MFQEDKFKKKYLKYKKKYLSMNGGGFYSAKKYEISPSGDKISLVYDTYNPDIENRNIRHVFDHVKISTFITEDLYHSIIKKINPEKCNINELIYKINDKYLLFSDIDSLNIFKELIYCGDDDNLIFPLDLKQELLYTWEAIYINKIYYEKSLFFIIFSGLLFSYDIKDIYGFCIDFCSECQFIIQNQDFVLSMDIFFTKLRTVIDIILKTYIKIKDTSTGNLKQQCLFKFYVNDILNINFKPKNNFDTLDYKFKYHTSETAKNIGLGYHSIVENKLEKIVRANPRNYLNDLKIETDKLAIRYQNVIC
jgi:hypothetical protein